MATVYAATNESIIDTDENHPVVKIGITDQSIADRMRGLNVGVPKPYDCFYALEVGDMKKAREVEKLIFEAFKKDRVGKKEFFRLEKDSVSSIFLALEIAGFENVTPEPEDTVEEEEHKRVVERRKNFTFGEVGIEKGTILQFKGYDEDDEGDKIICEVVGDKKILFEEKETSLSDAASIVLDRMGTKRKNKKAVAGTLYWYYKGKSLDEWRKGQG